MVLRGGEGGICDAVGVTETLSIVDTVGASQSQSPIVWTEGSLFGGLVELSVASTKDGGKDWRFRRIEIVQLWKWELVSYR